MSIEPVIIIATIANVAMIACNVIFMISQNVKAAKILNNGMRELVDESRHIESSVAESEHQIRKYVDDAAQFGNSVDDAENRLAELTKQLDELTEKYGIMPSDIREFTCEVCCDSDTEEATTALRTLDNKTKELVSAGYEVIDSGTRIKHIGPFATVTVVYIKYRTKNVKV